MKESFVPLAGVAFVVVFIGGHFLFLGILFVVAYIGALIRGDAQQFLNSFRTKK